MKNFPVFGQLFFRTSSKKVFQKVRHLFLIYELRRTPKEAHSRIFVTGGSFFARQMLAKKKLVSARRACISAKPISVSKVLFWPVIFKRASLHNSGPRAKPRASPPTPRTAPLAGKRSGGKGVGSRGKAKRTGRHEDKVGEESPNGLPRLVGGNLRGQPCKDHARGRCRFDSCSYSHA